MIMITGGAFQGKREFAIHRFGISGSDIADGAETEPEKLCGSRCICHYEQTVKRLLSENKDPLEFTGTLDCEIVIINEIGSGIIPLEKSEREWREAVGRAGCILAAKSDTVYRVCCGIPTVIKGEKT